MRIISTADELNELKSQMGKSERRLAESLQKLSSSENLLDVLKFESAGFNPWQADKKMHIIEQINLHATYEVALEALQYLLAKHPGKSWNVQPGNTGRGSDLSSTDGEIIAEVFAAVRSDNNKKIDKDIRRLTGRPAKFKYLFYRTAWSEGFMTPEFNHVDSQIQAIHIKRNK